jgi:hypothetical protein
MDVWDFSSGTIFGLAIYETVSVPKSAQRSPIFGLGVTRAGAVSFGTPMWIGIGSHWLDRLTGHLAQAVAKGQTTIDAIHQGQ